MTKSTNETFDADLARCQSGLDALIYLWRSNHEQPGVAAVALLNQGVHLLKLCGVPLELVLEQVTSLWALPTKKLATATDPTS